MDSSKPHISSVIVFLAVTLLPFLLACEASVVTEVSQATASPTAVGEPDPTATATSTSTVMETAVTPTPLPPTPTASAPTATPSPHRHTVQAGENLTIIADVFGTTANSIQQANKILNSDSIYVGQELLIPVDGGSEALESSDERDILHNQYLCPSTEAFDLEGGTIIGHSAVCKIPIVSYQLGEGEKSLVLVGGVHGGYEWNTILLAYEFLDYLRLRPDLIPDSLNITIIPNANPDGLYAVTRQVGRFHVEDIDDDTVVGRFNGRYVDLNRNWDCEWTPNAIWRDNPVSGGTAPFSEPENQSLRDFFLEVEPAAVLFYHSSAGMVFASGCGEIDPASERLSSIYSQASGYPQSSGFYQYVITGDASNWLAEQGIPAITVELTTHESIDWRINFAGLNALMTHMQFNP